MRSVAISERSLRAGITKIKTETAYHRTDLFEKRRELKNGGHLSVQICVPHRAKATSKPMPRPFAAPIVEHRQARGDKP